MPNLVKKQRNAILLEVREKDSPMVNIAGTIDKSHAINFDHLSSIYSFIFLETQYGRKVW